MEKALIRIAVFLIARYTVMVPIMRGTRDVVYLG